MKPHTLLSIILFLLLVGCNHNNNFNKNVAELHPEGNLIAEYGNVKIYSNFYVNEDTEISADDMTSKEDLFILKYVDNCPKDTMTVIGPFNTICRR